ncbi:MAG: hypothetical protein ACK5KP_07440 [Paludibacteraceae bacterium]
MSKNVGIADALDYFKHDTIEMIHSQITPYNSYNDRKRWMLKNLQIKNSVHVTNTPDSIRNGSYIDWEGANTLNLLGGYYWLPTKDIWQGLINRFFGEALAGYNLQVDNRYGMGLGLHGYFYNNQDFENGRKGYYWTATEVNETHAWALEVSQNSDLARFVSLPKNYRCKVRLIF